MTTKQINNIKTVNENNINGLAMSIFNAFEIVKKLEEVTKGEAENKELLANIESQLLQALVDCQTLVPENKNKQLEESEYHLIWVAYKKANSLDKDWNEGFDTRTAAINYLVDRDLLDFGKVACQVQCEYDKGTLYAYGTTKREALIELKKKAAAYGVLPIDPFKM